MFSQEAFAEWFLKSEYMNNVLEETRKGKHIQTICDLCDDRVVNTWSDVVYFPPIVRLCTTCNNHHNIRITRALVMQRMDKVESEMITMAAALERITTLLECAPRLKDSNS